MNALLVVVTMDCEPPNSSGVKGASGPGSWRDSERFIRNYTRLAAERALPVSFFIHPEVALEQADVFGDLAAQGCDTRGLHLHPWKYGGIGANLHLGHMDEAGQREIIAAAAADWSEGFGVVPEWFRPGTFSANDATARILVELGFFGGSISVPGRVFPDLGAIWAGCPSEPHLAHSSFRMIEGDLPFANMPLTVDFGESREAGCRRWHPDLRPDQSFEDIDAAAARVVGQVIAREDDIPVVNLVTHNDNDYSDPSNAVRDNYVRILDAILSEAVRQGVEPVGATVGDVCARVHDRATRTRPFVPV